MFASLTPHLNIHGSHRDQRFCVWSPQVAVSFVAKKGDFFAKT